VGARGLSIQPGAAPVPARRERHGSEAALAGLELRDGGLQVGGAEVRPHAAGEDQLGVGTLSEQEIAETLLAARADEQVERRNVGRVKTVVDRVFRDLGRR